MKKTVVKEKGDVVVRFSLGPHPDPLPMGEGAWNSSPHHDDVLRRKNGYRLVRGGLIRNELVGIISQPDERPADGANLAMVGENDSLAGLSHHGAMNGGLIRIVRRQPVLGVCAVNPNERFVEKRLVNIPLRLVPDKGELVTAQVAASHR